MKVALVGACGYGAGYLNALLEPRADCPIEIVGIVDPHASKSRRFDEVKRRGIPWHTDVESLFAAVHDRIDLTILSTPIHLHAPHTLEALARGSNVLCEKPLAATLEDAVAVESAERRSGKFVAVGFQWSFSRAVQALKRDVMAGLLGKPKRFRTLVIFPRGDNYYGRNGWAGRLRTDDRTPVYDSPLNNAAAHYLHNMLYVLGANRECSAWPVALTAELYRANRIESFDTAAVRCTTGCGVELLMYTTHASPRRVGPVFRYEFDEAVVEYDHAGGGEIIARFNDGRVHSYGQPEADRSEKLWQSIDAAAGGSAVPCGAAAAIPHAACVAAARDSCPQITGFPDALIRRKQISGEMMTCVDRLEEDLANCFEVGALPSDAGVSWARAGRRVDVPTPRLEMKPVLQP